MALIVGVAVVLVSGLLGTVASGDGVWAVIALAVVWAAVMVVGLGWFLVTTVRMIRQEYRTFQVSADRARRLARGGVHSTMSADDATEGEADSPIGVRTLLGG